MRLFTLVAAVPEVIMTGLSGQELLEDVVGLLPQLAAVAPETGLRLAHFARSGRRTARRPHESCLCRWPGRAAGFPLFLGEPLDDLLDGLVLISRSIMPGWGRPWPAARLGELEPKVLQAVF